MLLMLLGIAKNKMLQYIKGLHFIYILYQTHNCVKVVSKETRIPFTQIQVLQNLENVTNKIKLH